MTLTIRLLIIFNLFWAFGYSSHHHMQPHLEFPNSNVFKHSSQCALVISRSKSRLYDSINLASIFQPNYANYIPRLNYKHQLCITYEDVNRAVYEAKSILGNYIPTEINEVNSNLPKEAHIAVSAEIILEATRLLAHWFHLTPEAVIYGLPKIDTFQTAIRDICPSLLKPLKCEPSEYRTLSGMCNNLEYQSWGSSRSAYIRFLPPAYADGISEPRRSVIDNNELPSPRLLSLIVHQDLNKKNSKTTNLFMTFGQLIAHDLTFGLPVKDKYGDNLKCCAESHPSCFPISVPSDDPFYKYFKKSCINFVRLYSALKPSCPLGPRSPVNSISSFIDANFIYGSNQELSHQLRKMKGGLLKTTSLYRESHYKELLPLKTDYPDQACQRKGKRKDMFCFKSGDARTNIQLGLTILITLWMREHNRIARHLSHFNILWNDEKLFQETRKIVIAEFQHIIFNEYLPIVLGRELMNKYDLDLSDDYYQGYDQSANPSIRLGFGVAAFRFGHSTIPDVFERYNKFHEKLESVRISKLMEQPYDLYKLGYLDSYLMGLFHQSSYPLDSEISTEMTNHLFEKPGENFGRDLAATNIQRGREVGLPGYNAFRKFCGLEKATDFDDLIGFIENKTLYRISNLYKHVDDIDLWTAGIAEYPLAGSYVGPTFSCLIGKQFANIRKGDRFWYENIGMFERIQLNEIRKVKLARLMCDNADDIGSIQLYPFLMADSISNPFVDCDELPQMDLSVFIDP